MAPQAPMRASGATGGAIGGAVAGGLMGGPVGIVVGGVLGGVGSAAGHTLWDKWIHRHDPKPPPVQAVPPVTPAP